MGILLAHEFGHYFVGRYHREATSLPLFIPAPFTLFGTMDAVIFETAGSQKSARIARYRHRWTIGWFGSCHPGIILWACVVALNPLNRFKESLFSKAIRCSICLLNTSPLVNCYPPPPHFLHNHCCTGWVTGWPELARPTKRSRRIIAPDCLGWLGRLVHHRVNLPTGWTTQSWPCGIRLTRQTCTDCCPIVMVALGLLSLRWVGWLLWLALLWFFGQRPASVRDEVTDLNPKRQGFAILMLVIFVLVFIPVPLFNLLASHIRAATPAKTRPHSVKSIHRYLGQFSRFRLGR